METDSNKKGNKKMILTKTQTQTLLDLRTHLENLGFTETLDDLLTFPIFRIPRKSGGFVHVELNGFTIQVIIKETKKGEDSTYHFKSGLEFSWNQLDIIIMTINAMQNSVGYIRS